MNFYKHHIGDYAKKTGHLTLAEHGAYLLMLHTYYATEEPLPTGKALHRLLRADTKAEREAVDSVAQKFWRETEEGLVNDRAIEEIRAAQHQRTVNREIGKLGGRPKKTESVYESDTEREPNRNPPKTPDSRLQTPEEETQSQEHARAPARRAHRLPEAFALTPERRAVAEAERLDPERTFAKFCDYWHAASGAKARKLDWDATWRNWCRTEADRSRTGGMARPTTARRILTADEIEAQERTRAVG